MINAVAEMTAARQPGVHESTLRANLATRIEAEIGVNRKHNPDFLWLTEADESLLAKGDPLADSGQRIADAKKLLVEYELELPHLVRDMLSKHEVGTLSPKRTELLAQLMSNTWEQAKAALGKSIQRPADAPLPNKLP